MDMKVDRTLHQTLHNCRIYCRDDPARFNAIFVFVSHEFVYHPL